MLVKKAAMWAGAVPLCDIWRYLNSFFHHQHVAKFLMPKQLPNEINSRSVCKNEGWIREYALLDKKRFLKKLAVEKNTAEKMKFSIKYFFSKWDLVTFTEEILDGKLHFLCSEIEAISRKCFLKNMSPTETLSKKRLWHKCFLWILRNF